MSLYLKGSEFSSCINSGKVVVMEFTAAWCGPCKAMAAPFEALEREYPNLIFVKIDLDEEREIAEQCEITSVPTFLVYKHAQLVDLVKGADVTMLKSMVARHAK
jgi:thioredoxin